MAYIIDPNPVFWSPVKVRTPTVDGPLDESFRVKFKALSIDEFNSYDLSSPDDTRRLMAEVLLDADELEDKDKQPMAFSEAVRDQLINIPHVRAALVRAYVHDFAEAARGN